MKVTLPYKLRIALYVFTALGTPIIAYLSAKGYLGELEVALWSAEVTIVAGMAAFNVVVDDK